MKKDIKMTDVIQRAYDDAKKQLELGSLPISEEQDLCHMAHGFALRGLLGSTKSLDYEKHYSKPLDELYELFDNNTLSLENSYASFAFCYLKVLEIEGVIKHKSFLAQFEFEKKKHKRP